MKWGQAVSKYIYENWSRYLDDCEIPLDKSRINPEDLLTLLNSLNRKIKFTMNDNEKEITFLDIMIKQDSTIWMDLYHELTDMQRYVPFNSNYLNHCKRNIPFTLARWICTIVENNDRKTVHLNQLCENLIKQKYLSTYQQLKVEEHKNMRQGQIQNFPLPPDEI